MYLKKGTHKKNTQKKHTERITIGKLNKMELSLVMPD